MPKHLLLSGLLLAASLGCVAPQPTLTRAERMEAWVGRTWEDFMKVQGLPKQLTQQPDGSRIAVYIKSRVSTTPGTRQQVVDSRTGQRMTVAPGQNSDALGQRVGRDGDTYVQKEAPIRVIYSCTTTVRVSAQGLIERIEVTGNGCG